MKRDRLFWGFTLTLSLLAGGAGVLSLGPAQSHLSAYQILDPVAGEVFEVQVLASHQSDLEAILTQDPLILHLSGKPFSGDAEAGQSRYLHLNTRQTVMVQPYVKSFFRSFFLVWGIYFVVQYLVRHLVIREFRKTLDARKRKTRRGKRYAK